MNFPPAEGDAVPGGTVLIVDDNDVLLSTVKSILESRGFVVVTSRSVICGHLIVKHAPDVILMDVNMPGMSGPEACRAFTTVPGLLDRSLLVLHSSMDRSQLHTLMKESGADAVMPKGLAIAALVSQMEAFVERARAKSRRV